MLARFISHQKKVRMVWFVKSIWHTLVLCVSFALHVFVHENLNVDEDVDVNVNVHVRCKM